MKETIRYESDEEMIDLLELVRLFTKKLPVILLVAMVGAITLGLYTHYGIAPKYQATSKLYVVSASKDSVVNLSDLQIGTNLTADYQELIFSRPMMESVIQNLGLTDVTAEELKTMLRVEIPSSTRILEITATSTDPHQAEQIANEMARLSITWLSSVMESSEPNLVEEAVVPTKKSSPSLARNTILGGLVAAIVCYAIYVVRFLIDDTVTTPEAMEKYFGFVPLASIPEDKSLTIAKGDGRESRRWYRSLLRKGRRTIFAEDGGKK